MQIPIYGSLRIAPYMIPDTIRVMLLIAAILNMLRKRTGDWKRRPGWCGRFSITQGTGNGNGSKVLVRSKFSTWEPALVTCERGLKILDFNIMELKFQQTSYGPRANASDTTPGAVASMTCPISLKE